VEQRDSNVIAWERPVRLEGVRYELPEFIDYKNPLWHLKAAPYAHYVVQVSEDGERWTMVADRRHGAWRGMNTDFFAPVTARFLRFDGTFSDGKPFRVGKVAVLQ
jgi:hypothetical protein